MRKEPKPELDQQENLQKQDPDSMSISEVTRLYVVKKYDLEDARQVRRAVEAKAQPDNWLIYFQEKLDHLN